jgi:hypothetical protein
MIIVTMIQLMCSGTTSHFTRIGILILQQRVTRGMLVDLPLTLNNPVSGRIIENIRVFKQAKSSVWAEDKIRATKHSL